jgi:hypothetical protein
MHFVVSTSFACLVVAAPDKDGNPTAREDTASPPKNFRLDMSV